MYKVYAMTYCSLLDDYSISSTLYTTDTLKKACDFALLIIDEYDCDMMLITDKQGRIIGTL